MGNNKRQKLGLVRYFGVALGAGIAAALLITFDAWSGCPLNLSTYRVMPSALLDLNLVFWAASDDSEESLFSVANQRNGRYALVRYGESGEEIGRWDLGYDGSPNGPIASVGIVADSRVIIPTSQKLKIFNSSTQTFSSLETPDHQNIAALALGKDFVYAVRTGATKYLVKLRRSDFSYADRGIAIAATQIQTDVGETRAFLPLGSTLNIYDLRRAGLPLIRSIIPADFGFASAAQWGALAKSPNDPQHVFATLEDIAVIEGVQTKIRYLLTLNLDGTLARKQSLPALSSSANGGLAIYGGRLALMDDGGTYELTDPARVLNLLTQVPLPGEFGYVGNNLHLFPASGRVVHYDLRRRTGAVVAKGLQNTTSISLNGSSQPQNLVAGQTARVSICAAPNTKVAVMISGSLGEGMTLPNGEVVPLSLEQMRTSWAKEVVTDSSGAATVDYVFPSGSADRNFYMTFIEHTGTLEALLAGDCSSAQHVHAIAQKFNLVR